MNTIATLDKIMSRWRTDIRLEVNGSDFIATCFGRVGYGDSLQGALDDLVAKIMETISERVARKLES